MLDAVVVGAGPNGLAAAIRLAQEGLKVRVIEGRDTPGGGLRSEFLTKPGYVSDVCASVFPLAAGSPFLRELPLQEHGLRWLHGDHACVHPTQDGTCATITGSVQQTAERLGPDGPTYREVIGPLVDAWPRIEGRVFRPLFGWPGLSGAGELARFGRLALRSARAFARARFVDMETRALWSGMAAHSGLPLSKPASNAVPLVLAISAHRFGWPVAQGGAQSLCSAMVAYLERLGGTIRTGMHVRHLDELPAAGCALLDVSPGQAARMLGSRLEVQQARPLARFRHGPGVFKLDWALDGPIPWRCPEARRSATVHLGGPAELVALSEQDWGARPPGVRPFVLLTQPTVVDETRCPAGHHVAWAYCHVPLGSADVLAAAVEEQVERFAPGFRRRILARHARSALALQDYNPNCVGGDINGGTQDLRQMLARPTVRRPYVLPVPGTFLCSSSTPPGGGVHGMCGFNAAEEALAHLRSAPGDRPGVRDASNR